MIPSSNPKPEERASEMKIPAGCILCGGDLTLKVTPAGARSCCPACRWFSSPKVEVGQGGLSVHYLPAGYA